MLFRLTRVTLSGSSDWTERNDWAQRAIDVSGDEPSPMCAEALTSRALGSAVLAATFRDHALAVQAAEWAEVGVAMSEQFSAPWRMYCRLLAGETYTTLNLTRQLSRGIPRATTVRLNAARRRQVRARAMTPRLELARHHDC
jgi:hypothetical protein